jgi:hypothetical protein
VFWVIIKKAYNEERDGIFLGETGKYLPEISLPLS